MWIFSYTFLEKRKNRTKLRIFLDISNNKVVKYIKIVSDCIFIPKIKKAWRLPCLIIQIREIL